MVIASRPQATAFGVQPQSGIQPRRKSGRGLPQSKTLARWQMGGGIREAFEVSPSSAALWRWRRQSGAEVTAFQTLARELSAGSDSPGWQGGGEGAGTDRQGLKLVW
jgi:hypothetical protein